MDKIVECVPNISDGRNPAVYNTVASACEKIAGVQLLDIDPGVATNRTVITFAGPPELMVDAAFEVIKAAKEMIDMRQHKGEHARMGATDVCPFVPVSGVSLAECADLARALAKKVGQELGVWAYLYEEAASKPEWKSLPNVRQGEYEGLAARQGKAEWKPDAGPETFDPKFGAVAIGARKFLIAYNINANSKNLKMMKDIAFNIRQSGRVKRDSYPDGKMHYDSNGNKVMIPGTFTHCKGTAWIIPEYGCAQITMNLTDIDETPVHAVFDEVLAQAQERGIRITGSEVVGLVPLQVLLEAGRHYAQKQGLSLGCSEAELVSIAIRTLGLSDVAPFDPAEKIVEYRFRQQAELVSKTCTDFVETLASDEPAPGGGSVAALCGAMAASLGSMTGSLTYGKIEYKDAWKEMETAGIQAHALKSWYMDAVDKDTHSFNAVMDAIRLPKDTEADQQARAQALEEAYKGCTQVPLDVLEKTLEILPILTLMVEKGNSNCASDVGVGAFCLLTCAEGAALNVKINLPSVKDTQFSTACTKKMQTVLERVRQEVDLIVQKVHTLIEQS